MLPQSSLRHPQFDEDFLKFESKVDELVKYLKEVQANAEGNVDDSPAKGRKSLRDEKKTDDEITVDNFIVKETADRSWLYKKTCYREEEEEDEDKKPPFTLDKHAFMSQIEVDAAERAEARRDRLMIAKQLKT